MKIKTWLIITLIVCLILGTLLHFTYEWSGENIIVGIFSAVNESTWEHLKLVFFPMIFMSLIGYFAVEEKSNNYWLAQGMGILTAILFIIAFFYTYTGIIGTNFAWLNIATFVVAISFGIVVIYKILIIRSVYNAEVISAIFLTIIFFSFILYTFAPPKIQLFQDPLSRKYGINNLT